MTLYGLDDDQIRDLLSQTATLIDTAKRFVNILADGSVQFPKAPHAREELIQSALRIQMVLADELDAARILLDEYHPSRTYGLD